MALSLDNENVAFKGSGRYGSYGIYTNIGGKLNVVADVNTRIPGGTGYFGSFGYLSLNNENVVFDGREDGGEEVGIYISNDGVLDIVVDQTPIVDSGLYESFSGLSLDDGNVAFKKVRRLLAEAKS